MNWKQQQNSRFKSDKMFGAGGKIIMKQQNNYALIN